MRLLLAAVAFSCSADVAELDCTSPPPSPIPSQLAPRTMAEVHWDDEGGCIEMSYSPVLRDRERVLIDAATQWTELGCSGTCFLAPVERADSADGRAMLGTIHITELSMPSQTGLRTFTDYSTETGGIQRALVMLDPTLDAERFLRVLLRGLGHSFGFDVAPMEIQSVMNPFSGLDQISDVDEQAFCAKYGECR